MNKGCVIAASLGNCVHVAGAVHFLSLAAEEGYETEFLGPAVSVERILEEAEKRQPVMVAVGYRLTPENVVPLLEELQRGADTLSVRPKWVFGGTRPVAEQARKFPIFEKVFDGSEDVDETISFLRGEAGNGEELVYAQDVRMRMAQKKPYPLLRHHFGLPSYEETCRGIRKIAESKVLDVISIGPDQNTQQYYFHPERMNRSMDGAGGVPLRSEQDFSGLKEAANRGNHPLLRCYSGTADVFDMAQLLIKTIDNAWPAIPLSWYNELDGRGTRTLEESVSEAQELIRWHARRGMAVEINEPHHWGLRDAHDTISVVMAFLSAYYAKQCGVKDYIAQYMFNIPNGMSFSMDLAKVLAQIELAESLCDENFRAYREVRAGLPFLSSDLDVAKGQLAASTYLSMAVQPDIIHVVGYSEAEHAASAEVVIESTKIVRGVVRSILHGAAGYQGDLSVQKRKMELIEEAKYLLEFIQKRYAGISSDPLCDPVVLCDCIKTGILDAPHIVKGEKFKGTLVTRMIEGKCVAFDPIKGRPVGEKERLENLFAKEIGKEYQVGAC